LFVILVFALFPFVLMSEHQAPRLRPAAPTPTVLPTTLSNGSGSAMIPAGSRISPSDYSRVTSPSKFKSRLESLIYYRFSRAIEKEYQAFVTKANRCHRLLNANRLCTSHCPSSARVDDFNCSPQHVFIGLDVGYGTFTYLVCRSKVFVPRSSPCV
jgi:hypothetical protein